MCFAALRPRLLAIGLFLATWVSLPLAHAAEPSRSQQISKTCRDLSQAQLDTGVTADMREAMAKTAACLEDNILKIASEEFFKESPEKLEKFKADFKAYGDGAKSMSWALHNEADWCEQGCGTMGYVMAPGAYTNMLEVFLEEMLAATVEGMQPAE